MFLKPSAAWEQIRLFTGLIRSEDSTLTKGLSVSPVSLIRAVPGVPTSSNDRDARKLLVETPWPKG